MSDSNPAIPETIQKIKTEAKVTLAELEQNLYKLQNLDHALSKLAANIRQQRIVVNDQFSAIRVSLQGFEKLNIKVADTTRKIESDSSDSQKLVNDLVNQLTGGKILFVDGEDNANTTPTANDGDTNERF